MAAERRWRAWIYFSRAGINSPRRHGDTNGELPISIGDCRLFLPDEVSNRQLEIANRKSSTTFAFPLLRRIAFGARIRLLKRFEVKSLLPGGSHATPQRLASVCCARHRCSLQHSRSCPG